MNIFNKTKNSYARNHFSEEMNDMEWCEEAGEVRPPNEANRTGNTEGLFKSIGSGYSRSNVLLSNGLKRIEEKIKILEDGIPDLNHIKL